MAGNFEKLKEGVILFKQIYPKSDFLKEKKFESAKKATERCQKDFFVCCLRLSPSLYACFQK